MSGGKINASMLPDRLDFQSHRSYINGMYTPTFSSRRPCRFITTSKVHTGDRSGFSSAADSHRKDLHVRSFGHRPAKTFRTAAAVSAQEESSVESPVLEKDSNGLERVKYQKQGWKFWQWRGNKIHYIQAGQPSKPPIVLVHGFGASAYHWRYIIPELAKTYSVYAVDLLGFGMSEKPSVVYNGYKIWSNQLTDFIKEIVNGRPSVLVGNSMGAYASLLTSADHPEVSRGLVLVNGAGKFEEVKAAVQGLAEAENAPEIVKEALEAATGVDTDMPSRSISNQVQDAPLVTTRPSDKRPPAGESQNLFNAIWNPIQTIAKRTAIYFAFIAAKQPSRIRQVLKQVYVSSANIDDDLVNSIVEPAQDPNAPDVFYRVISSEGASINSLLQKIKAPLFLLWGELDPWITPASADKIQRLFPAAKRVDVRGGHCPHDDVPELFLPPLKSWLEALP